MNKENQIQQIADEAIKKIQAIRDAREEKEFRAGEWVPGCGEKYYFPSCGVNESQWDGGTTDMNRLNSVGVYPTIAIAEAAKAHADWWREFDMIADAPLQYTNDKGMYEVHRAGICSSWAITFRPPEIIIHPQEIVRLGGEQNVIDMLTRGRVFRFKWGGK